MHFYNPVRLDLAGRSYLHRLTLAPALLPALEPKQRGADGILRVLEEWGGITLPERTVILDLEGLPGMRLHLDDVMTPLCTGNLLIL